jgi:Icc-related predicted phosphoesterase
MSIKLIADVHSFIQGIEEQVGSGDTLLVLGDVLGLIDWADFSGILPEVLGRENFTRMLYEAFAGGEEAAQALRDRLLNPGGESYQQLRGRVEGDYRSFRAVLEEIGCNALVIYGNADLPFALVPALEGSSRVRMVEGVVELEGRKFGFLPGAIKSPFAMPAESDDEEFYKMLKRMGRVDVLCAHIPPDLEEITYDVVAGMNSRGSSALLQYIREVQPAWVYHGHIHHPRQRVHQIGRTRVVNVAYFKEDRYVHVHGE